VISEEECVRCVLDAHAPDRAEKFLQELLWRVYWKGWLELRPAVWDNYLRDAAALSSTHENTELYQRAVRGDTPLPFFNAWVSELTKTGYLHNHTRMWFASVWIFTLNLPWQLGARFMYHHLLDGDAASNTLSWRWVAGLHTQGKIYVARPDNIATYSDGRWSPRSSDLNVSPPPPHCETLPPPGALPGVSTETPRAGSLILLHDDDLSADLSGELACDAAHYCVFTPRPVECSNRKIDLLSALRTDAAKRIAGPLLSSADEVFRLAQKVGADQVHMMIPRIGFELDSITRLSSELRTLGISFFHHRRSWDERLMQHARSGFFTFWERAKSSL
jgi:deoxyribodipyrimidine photo-lyase